MVIEDWCSNSLKLRYVDEAFCKLLWLSCESLPNYESFDVRVCVSWNTCYFWCSVQKWDYSSSRTIRTGNGFLNVSSESLWNFFQCTIHMALDRQNLSLFLFLELSFDRSKKKKWARQLLIRSVTKRRSKVIYLLSVYPCKNTKLCLTNVFILCGIKYLTKRVLAQKSIVNHHRSVLSARGKKQTTK